jgi:hypothetical protein
MNVSFCQIFGVLIIKFKIIPVTLGMALNTLHSSLPNQYNF